MSNNIDTRISLDLDPDAVMATIADYDEDTSSYLSTARSAFNEAYSALRAIHDAKAGAATDPTLNDAARLLRVDDFANRRMTSVYKLWDTASASLDKTICGWEKEMSKEVESKASQMVSGEIRTHFKNLPTGERMAAIQQAIRDGDETTATAVLGAPAFLAGFNQEMKAILLREWHERSNPGLAKRLRAVTAARDLIDGRLPVLRAEKVKAVGDIKVWKESKAGPPVLVRTITPAEVRNAKNAADAPFAVTGA